MMNPTIQLAPLHRTVLLGAGIVIIGAGMRAAAPAVNIVLVSLLLAMTIYPVPHLLSRRGMKRSSAVLLTMLGVLIVAVLLTTALAISLGQMTERLPIYEAALAVFFTDAESWLAARGVDLQTSFRPDPKGVMQTAGTLAGNAFEALAYGALALILVALILFEMPMDKKDRVAQGSIQDRFEDIAVSVRRFLALNSIIGGVQAVASLIAMVGLGTDFPLLWAALIFLVNLVPFGFAFALLPPLALTLLEQGVGRAIALFAILTAINLIADNVIKPNVVGQGLGLSPLVVVLAFVFWAYVLGPMGAILAIPLTIAIYKSLPLLIAEPQQSS
jgi:predicted PurR-regulated permease PerM